MRPGLQRLLRGFGEPVALTALSIAGLTAALVGEGFSKMLGVAAAATPLLAILRHVLRARRSASSTRKPS